MIPNIVRPFAAFFVAFVVMFPSLAEAQCAPARAPVVEVTVTEPEVMLDTRLSSTQIEALNVRTRHAEGHVVNGLTKGRFESSLNHELVLVPSRDGGYCASPRRISAVMGWVNMTVFVADRFDPGSCQYETVMEHEREHVAINLAAVRRHEGAVRAALETAAAAFPIRVSDQNDARTKSSAILKPAFDAAVRRLVAEADMENAALDTPESYARWQAMCRSW